MSVHNPERRSAHYQRRKVTSNSATNSAAIYNSDLPAWHASIVVAQSLCFYDWSFCYMLYVYFGGKVCVSLCWNTNLGWATKMPQGHYESSVWCSTKDPWFMLKQNTTDALSVFVLLIFCPLTSAPMRPAILQYCNWDSLSNWKKLKMQSCACF